MNKHTYVALALAFLITFSAALVATTYSSEVRILLGLTPFKWSGSASVGMSNQDRRYIIRPISDRYQLKFMDFIASTTTGEEEAIIEGRHPELCSWMNRTELCFSMGWANTTKIRIFGFEYDAWYIQMWVRNEALYLNLRYQDKDHVLEKLFLIDDPSIAVEAHELMINAWSGT